MAFVRRKRGQVLLVHNEREAGSARVRQRELHCFTTPLELDEVLTPSGWARWTRALAWREGAIAFDWPALRVRLTQELEAWRRAPSGAKHRRNQKIARLASDLAVELAPLSGAKTADAAVIERVRPELLALREAISRLLPPSHRLELERREPKENSMHPIPTTENPSANDLFDEGMEHWWARDRPAAARLFRRALKLDPLHADAHNHLGIVSFERRRLEEAERHFRAAIVGGERGLERRRGRLPWTVVENRPYLRALGNLARTLAQQKKWGEALTIHRRMLELNPSDEQGVRFLIGYECLHAGDDAGAVAVFQKGWAGEPGCAFGLALAKLRGEAPSEEVGEALLAGFSMNRYIAPMLLGERWERLDGFHASSQAEPEWADEVVRSQADLWQAIPRGADVLRFWWEAPVVAAWRLELDTLMVSLKDASAKERPALVTRDHALRFSDVIRDLVRSVRAAS